MDKKDRRFIEESFPVREVSAESAREKSIRQGHISTLHIWWARRPLAASRATSYAALIPAPNEIEEWEKKRHFIIELSKWENSLRKDLIYKVRKDILEANGGTPPKVIDPFGGGGSIPLEALRIGCEVYSNDLNPVAVFIQKCTLEYPIKYGKKGEVEKEVEEFGTKVRRKVNVDNVLVEDVRYWAEWVLEEARKEIGKFYPHDPDGSIPVGYTWARTIPCQNPSCGAEIPLIRQYWLVRKSNKKVALFPYVEGKDVKFKIVGDGYEEMPKVFDPDNGTVSRAVVTCPVCGSVIDDDTTRRLFQEGKSGERMIAVILESPGSQGKVYRLATAQDLKAFMEAEEYMKEKRRKLMEEWGMDPVPDEPLPPKETLGFRIQRYGFLKWGDLFNSRQKLALIVFLEKVKEVYRRMLAIGVDREYAKAVASYLAISIDNIAEKNNTISRWANTKETIAGSFSRQALPMVWDYFESNPFSGSTGDWLNSVEYNLNVIYHCSQSPKSSGLLANDSMTDVLPVVTQASATSLPYLDNFFDAVFTDPPYYDNVPYSHLSDFFYVWLKRSIGDLYPELFSTPLTPKSQEIVAYSHKEGGKEAGKKFFESMLKKAFQEIHRVLKPNGIAVIVYAHKSTQGWETLINSLLDSGLVITAAYPINTEMQTRLRAQESATLASSIYIVARKIEREPVGFYNNVREELKNHLTRKLERLWAEGIGGADFFIAAIGSAIEVFGKYEKVMDYEGNIIRADRLLEDVRKIATDFAVHQILHNGFAGEISELTRFYVLYRWNFGEAKVPFDEARKLATSCGIDLASEWNRKGFIKREKEFIRVLGPHERNIEDLKDSTELIDVLHHVLLLWEKGKRDDMLIVLKETGYGESEAFYRVAQAISETLPNESKEKKLLDGFLAGKERLREEVRNTKKYGLFD
ncbi:Adenine-specific DNA methylase, contains a Zn-ribbon domain [Fervidobacterium changbaicum]|uniref:DUF1156 domain-containing protein n=1 Tax=Fervidobacterium changbaicum TaxID=310769 RepID=A0ABX5QRW3_9BACT|nr:DUF1156 domain-containing protein [Fervidobacterium changbaicum]QAV33175.1 DUF1156 domain-containing protein [Fervidobacterium changbaicum]SDH12668.1 Adenine-specific DNA methylase, contains a Zn-ribbon domain [Fervidobacterium changbaicum]